MQKKFLLLAVFVLILLGFSGWSIFKSQLVQEQNAIIPQKHYWFLLYRKSNVEYLYYGILGDKNNSRLLKTFQVKTGNLSISPTPLPKLLGRNFWLITKKESSANNPETAPYFLTLDIPVTEEEPFGPKPYMECNGQCNWLLPGYFGLHGISGNLAKLSKDDLGSSGCVRHKDEDITYLYNLLNPEKEEIRYYIKDI